MTIWQYRLWFRSTRSSSERSGLGQCQI